MSFAQFNGIPSNMSLIANSFTRSGNNLYSAVYQPTTGNGDTGEQVFPVSITNVEAGIYVCYFDIVLSNLLSSTVFTSIAISSGGSNVYLLNAPSTTSGINRFSQAFTTIVTVNGKGDIVQLGISATTNDGSTYNIQASLGTQFNLLRIS
jgi:hypothetical protein